MPRAWVLCAIAWVLWFLRPAVRPREALAGPVVTRRGAGAKVGRS